MRLVSSKTEDSRNEQSRHIYTYTNILGGKPQPVIRWVLRKPEVSCVRLGDFHGGTFCNGKRASGVWGPGGTARCGSTGSLKSL